jgi:hypothetical protein
MCVSSLHNSHAIDVAVPGDVYLCQVSNTVSCGACCGLYNVRDISKVHVTNLLRHRSLVFQNTARTVSDIDAFAREMTVNQGCQGPFDKFHHCPFIGLIGDRLSRVGCLLHPLAHGNAGVDFRGMSYYGGLACHSYFCATTRQLPPRYKKILRVVLDDWFFYGLVITENKLLAALFNRIESCIGEPLDKRQFSSKIAADQLKDLLCIKHAWPFRPADQDTACHYLFCDGAYDRPAIDYRRLKTEPSLFDTILREMGSAFETADQLRQAERIIFQKINNVVDCLRSAHGKCHGR